MSYVIYNRITFRRMRGAQRQETFATERSARSVLTRAKAKDDTLIKADWIVATYGEWEQAEPMVETYNLLDPTRATIMIRASQLRTHLDPATDSYHSM